MRQSGIGSSLFRMLLLILTIGVSLTGCATPALIEKATHDRHVRSPITEDYSLRVTSASYFDKSRTIGICIERVHVPTRSTEEFFLRFPDPHYTRYETRFGKPYYDGLFGERAGVLVATQELPAYSTRQCSKGGQSVALIELPLDISVVLSREAQVAVFHSYNNGQLAALGYASNTPFLDNRYSFLIDVTRTSAYYTDRIEKGNRALLVLIPVAAVIDAAGFVLIAPPLALRCMEEPEWCKD